MGGEIVLHVIGYRNQLPSLCTRYKVRHRVEFSCFSSTSRSWVNGRSGAFEIYLDENQEIAPKLATGGFPKVRV
jgi:hypothetical protein